MTGARDNVITLPFVAERLALQERIADKRRELEDAVALADALFDRTLEWHRVYPDLTGPDKQDVAAEIAFQDAEQVREELRELEALAGGGA